MEKVLEKSNLNVGQIDLIEIQEAFAAQVLSDLKMMNLTEKDYEKTNLEVVQTLCEILSELAPPTTRHLPLATYRSLITYVADRPGHDRRYAIDAGKLERELGWKPEETFESGIRKTVTWYLDNQGWVANVIRGAYREWCERQYGK